MRLNCVRWETEPRAFEVITQETDTKEREREHGKNVSLNINVVIETVVNCAVLWKS